MDLRPQKGFQEKVLSSPADILICGGSSGPGKTWLLLVDPLRYYQVKGFNATIFRRTFPQISSNGGMWDKSMDLYPHFGARPVKSSMEHIFKHSRFVFRHMQNESDWIDFQGAEMCYIAFDELCQFERNQFFKVLAWNRSTCGVKPYVRASCNPDPDSFVAQEIDWYLREDGYPDPSRDGVLRYFVTIEDKPIWGSSKDEVYEIAKHKLDQIPVENKMDLIKSFTFIKGSVYENKELLNADPAYVANLMAMNEEEQMRFLHGNWKVKVHKDILCNYDNFKDIFTNKFVLEHNKRNGFKKYVTSDIATTGRDLFITAYWEGKVWTDISIIDKNNGKEAIEEIERMQIKHGVQNTKTLFDADGVGGGLTGHIQNCIEFKGNRTPIGKNNYKNLKSQCAFEFSYCINQSNQKTSSDAYYVSPYVSEMKFPYDSPTIYKGKTIGWILEHQIKAIRKDKPDSDQKLAIIKKDEQKMYLNGISPDFIEQFFFRELFEVNNFEPIKVKMY